MKILIVDGDEVFAPVLKEKLEKERFDVEIEKSGDAAFDRAKNVKPDLIAMELVLPGKDGFDVLEDLKANTRLNSVPVVIVATTSDDESIKRALASGAANYFSKIQHPVEEIVDAIKEHLLLHGGKKES